MRRLLTIPLSHYCERARWALDRAGVPYVEEPHLQGFHRRHVRRAGGGRTVPVLTDPGGSLTDSADIVRLAVERAPDGRLPGPLTAAGAALERRFAEELGVETRRLAYDRLFRDRRLLLEHNNRGAPRREDVALRAVFPLMERMMRSYMRIHPYEVDRARDRIGATLDLVAELLDDGRPYLDGDRFTTVDLTFASLAAPVVFPAEYGVPLPPLGRLGPAVADEIRGWRAHPAGRFALRLYAAERR